MKGALVWWAGAAINPLLDGDDDEAEQPLSLSVPSQQHYDDGNDIDAIVDDDDNIEAHFYMIHSKRQCIRHRQSSCQKLAFLLDFGCFSLYKSARIQYDCS